MDHLPLVNRVANSGIVTLDLARCSTDREVVGFDLTDFLFRGLVLREKEFRQLLEEHTWAKYSGKILAVHCSADAIVPTWAYMLVAVKAQTHCEAVAFGSPDAVTEALMLQAIDAFDIKPYEGVRVVLKGCSDKAIAPSAYLKMTQRLLPIVQSLMYGEPCSTVPIYKRKR